jgi:hypothetical protein
MLLVYTHKISPRIKYIFKQICTRILGIPVSFTTKIEEFIAHDSLKMSYSNQALGKELFVKGHSILFEQGLSDVEIVVQDWGNTKCFFANADSSSLPFDIFSASFYLLSRYEEYFPHVKDDYGRYTAKESLAYKNGFLQQPVVDIWAYKFQDELRKRFPNYSFPNRDYSINPVIDVPTAYYYKNKGLMRTIGGALNELSRLKLVRFYQRFLVLFNVKKDPYNTFNWIIDQQKKSKQQFKVFFLIGDYSTYDKNVSINRKAFVSLIKSIADYCKVGLKASYFSLQDSSQLKKEKQMMEHTINTSLELSRNSFSKLNLPHSYRNLVELEINEDYTMGYVNALGFRAGTCTPFLFYDIDYEIQTPLMVNSFHVLDFALLKHSSLLDKKEELLRIMYQVKKVNGIFVPVFHNYSFSDEPRWKGFKELFNLVLKSADEAY